MSTEKLRMRLNIARMEDFKAKIILKSKKYDPFIAKVKDFLYDEDDTKVVFQRCEETKFPGDTEDNKKEEFMTYIKNIKSVDRHE